MKKANYKKKQKLKSVGTATALTITLATSNVPTLAYAMELENNINEEVVAEELVVEEEEKKKKPTTQEEIISQEEADIQEQEISVQEEATTQEQVTDINFNLNDWDYNEWSTSIVLTEYKGSNTDIVIPGEFKGKAVSIASGCFSQIKPNLTSIEFKMENNKKVQTPNTLSTLFTTCEKLESVDLSGLDTSNVEDMTYMFKGCSSLTNITFGDKFNTSKVTNMQQMFRDCKSLRTLDLSSFNTDSVKDMSYMFNGCNELKTLDISGFNTSGLNVQTAFDGCTYLKSINLSKINDVQFISKIFSKCTSLQEVNLSEANLSSLTSLSSIFANCEITKLDLSKADLSGFKHFENIFEKHTYLKEVILRETNIPVKITSMSKMFNGLTELQKVDLTGTNFSNVTNINEMFRDCTSLQEVSLSRVKATAVTNAKSLFEGCSVLTTLNLEESNIAFAENTDENGNKLPTNMDNMFKNCRSLTNLNLSNFNTSNVTTMRSVFQECKALTSLDLSSFDTENVDNMNNMFKDCDKLNKITFGDNFKTLNVTSMEYMFSDSGVQSLDLSSFDTQNVGLPNVGSPNLGSMKGMFRNTPHLTNIKFSENFTTEKVKDMSFMFCNSGVESLDLSNFNTENVENMKAMFASLDNIKVLDLSNFNLDSVSKGNMEYMFANHITVDSNSDIPNEPSKDESEKLKKSLLVICNNDKSTTNNEKLMSYKYEEDYCLPGSLTLDANGGQFKNGDKTFDISLETNVVESVAAFIELKENLLKELELEQPTRARYKFISWEAKHSGDLNTDYKAKWKFISMVSPSVTAPSATESKLVGEDRYKTAIKVSNEGWNKADNVVIVNSSAIVDALSATPFAKMKNAPILLTESDKLNDETKKEIIRLGAKNVYVIGGTGVVSENVILQLKAMNLNLDRISGDDRYTTSLEIAKRLGSISEIAVVNGVTGLADAVSIAPVAANRNMPIVFSSPNEGTKVFDEFIKSNNIKTSYVIGREAAISEDIASKLPNSNRLGGLNRNETNAIILEKFYSNKNLNNIFVAKDGMKKVDDLIDALAVGVLASKENSPVVIVGDKLETKQEKLLKSKNPKEVTQVGGNGNENAFSQIVNMFK